jgi:hypothetical protein
MQLQFNSLKLEDKEKWRVEENTKPMAWYATFEHERFPGREQAQ